MNMVRRLAFALAPPMISAALVVGLSAAVGTPQVWPGAIVAFVLSLPWSTYFAFRKRYVTREHS